MHVEGPGLQRRCGEGVTQLVEVQTVEFGPRGSGLERVSVEPVGVEGALAGPRPAPPEAVAHSRGGGLVAQGLAECLVDTDQHISHLWNRVQVNPCGELPCSHCPMASALKPLVEPRYCLFARYETDSLFGRLPAFA